MNIEELMRMQEAEINRLREAINSARAAIEYDDDISTALILLKNALKYQAELEGGQNG